MCWEPVDATSPHHQHLQPHSVGLWYCSRRLGTVGSGTNEPMRVRPLPIPSVPSASSGTSALMKKKEPTTSRGRPIRLLPPMVVPIFLLFQWDFWLGYSLKLRKFGNTFRASVSNIDDIGDNVDIDDNIGNYWNNIDVNWKIENWWSPTLANLTIVKRKLHW